MTTVIPSFRVSSKATIDQWVDAFGLTLHAVHGDDGQGAVEHAELRFGDGWVMAGTPRGNAHDAPPGGATVYWVLSDPSGVDAIYARATGTGAESVMAPHDPDYGGRECSLRDRDGNLWSFGTYMPG